MTEYPILHNSSTSQTTLNQHLVPNLLHHPLCRQLRIHHIHRTLQQHEVVILLLHPPQLRLVHDILHYLGQSQKVLVRAYVSADGSGFGKDFAYGDGEASANAHM